MIHVQMVLYDKKAVMKELVRLGICFGKFVGLEIWLGSREHTTFVSIFLIKTQVSKN